MVEQNSISLTCKWLTCRIPWSPGIQILFHPDFLQFDLWRKLNYSSQEKATTNRTKKLLTWRWFREKDQKKNNEERFESWHDCCYSWFSHVVCGSLAGNQGPFYGWLMAAGKEFAMVHHSWYLHRMMMKSISPPEISQLH